MTVKSVKTIKVGESDEALAEFLKGGDESFVADEETYTITQGDRVFGVPRGHYLVRYSEGNPNGELISMSQEEFDQTYKDAAS